MRLAIGVLGPFEVYVDGRSRPVSAGRLRALLAALAVWAGRPVPVDRLAMALWGERLPGNARRGVQLYVTRLRALLGEASIGTSRSGYELRIAPDEVDALRFARLFAAARAEADPVQRYANLVAALRLWRGDPLEDVDSALLRESEGPRLVELRLLAVEQRIDMDLAAGEAAEVVAECGALVARFPLRESLWRRLLLALDRCGRQAEALNRYEAIRSRLADELGVAPGPDLRQAFADLLAGRSLRLATPTRWAAPRPWPDPRWRGL